MFSNTAKSCNSLHCNILVLNCFRIMDFWRNFRLLTKILTIYCRVLGQQLMSKTHTTTSQELLKLLAIIIILPRRVS